MLMHHTSFLCTKQNGMQSDLFNAEMCFSVYISHLAYYCLVDTQYPNQGIHWFKAMNHTMVISVVLSHTWVRYPGFQAMGLNVQYWPRWFQDYPAIWLAVPFGANGSHLGICTSPERNPLCVWNKLFLGEIKSSQRRTRPVKSLWCQIVPMKESTNE